MGRELRAVVRRIPGGNDRRRMGSRFSFEFKFSLHPNRNLPSDLESDSKNRVPKRESLRASGAVSVIFMGSMPEALREGSRVSGVELDPLSARMAAKLYPENRIELSGIEEALMVGDNTQDLVVGNVPFSDTAPAGQKCPVKLNLHNLCISRSIDKLRPGGWRFSSRRTPRLITTIHSARCGE